MFDEQMRAYKERVFTPLARVLRHVPPWSFSVIALFLGIGCALALWQQLYWLGFALWFLNRVFDSLDGGVARLQEKTSDLGGYLDILFDFVVYALIPIGLALGRPSTAVFLALIALLSTYYVNAASWMYLAAILEKRKQGKRERMTTVVMPAGIIGGTETVIFYGLFMLFPTYLVAWFGVMAFLTAVTVLQRLWWAVRHLA